MQQRSGPTGRQASWMIRTNSCNRCGRLEAVDPDLTWDQYQWLRRWNRHCEKHRRDHISILMDIVNVDTTTTGQ